MSSIGFWQLIWSEIWWKWNRPSSEPLTMSDLACHYFNLIEATAWFTFAVLVIWRWLRFRKSWLEVAYAAAFVMFGVSDAIESQVLTSWLLWWKAFNLLILFRLRSLILRRFYPDRRLF